MNYRVAINGSPTAWIVGNTSDKDSALDLWKQTEYYKPEETVEMIPMVGVAVHPEYQNVLLEMVKR